MEDPKAQTIDEIYSLLDSAQNIVVKIGTQVLTTPEGKLDEKIIKNISAQIAALTNLKKRISVVSSGAVGAGMSILGLEKKPKKLPLLQAIAAVGQAELIRIYEKYLIRYNLHAGQILVTRADFEDRRRYINIERTLNTLYKFQAIPIINENDAVTTDRIKFGDNDLISALIANLVQADLLIILTVVEGLLDEKGDIIKKVDQINDGIFKLLKAEKTSLGSGGMRTKLEAMKLATSAGIPGIIASGKIKDVLIKLLVGKEHIGTLFVPQEKKIRGKKRWLGLAEPAGRIIVDNGAAKAITVECKSLLPKGIIKVKGNFRKGNVVIVEDAEGRELARGITNFGSKQLSKIAGKHTEDVKKLFEGKAPDEVIHRDNLIVITTKP